MPSLARLRPCLVCSLSRSCGCGARSSPVGSARRARPRRRLGGGVHGLHPRQLQRLPEPRVLQRVDGAAAEPSKRRARRRPGEPRHRPPPQPREFSVGSCDTARRRQAPPRDVESCQKSHTQFKTTLLCGGRRRRPDTRNYSKDNLRRAGLGADTPKPLLGAASAKRVPVLAELRRASCLRATTSPKFLQGLVFERYGGTFQSSAQRLARCKRTISIRCVAASVRTCLVHGSKTISERDRRMKWIGHVGVGGIPWAMGTHQIGPSKNIGLPRVCFEMLQIEPRSSSV